MSNEQSVADVLAKLTKAQLEAVLACRSRGRNVRTGELCFWRAWSRARGTADALVRLGISYPLSRFSGGAIDRTIELTPLGLAVHAAARACLSPSSDVVEGGL